MGGHEEGWIVISGMCTVNFLKRQYQSVKDCSGDMQTE